jgi:simple sugar transport system ATP-binding protein
MLLKIDTLHKRYGGVHALAGVSLQVEAGQVLGLMGDNGAGKSTLVKCITGSECPDSGTIAFNGAELVLGNPSASRAAGIEMIYQDLNLYPQADAIFNIFLGCELRLRVGKFRLPLLDKRTMQAAARQIVTQLNAEIDVSKPVRLLSGGQQQAIAIARALQLKPRLLIMDEPTAALGVKERSKVLGLIKTLKQQGLTVIIISHNLNDIFEVSDRVVLMRHGAMKADWFVSDTSPAQVSQSLLAEVDDGKG